MSSRRRLRRGHPTPAAEPAAAVDWQANFQALIENFPDAVAVHRDGRFLYLNPRALELLGYARAEELIGKSVLDIVHPDDRTFVVERMRLGKLAPPQEERFLRRDGTVVTGEVTALPIRGAGGPTVVVVVRDLSVRKELTAKMMQLDRIIAVGTLAAGVGHEINNPLAYVVGNLEYLAEALRPLAASGALGVRGDELVEVLTDARQGAERIRRIVRDLRTFARADDEARAPVELKEVLDSAINMAWNEIRHRARLVKDYGPAPLVEGIAGKLGQVFLNLLVNAAQAIPEGAADRHEIRVVTSTDAAGRACVDVRDTGNGIPTDVLPRIFDPFFTTKPIGQGTGLGLSICRQIVGQFGGEIAVESAPGAGTTFRVVLPPLAKSARLAPAPATSEGKPRARRARVLIVDDEPLVGVALSRVLGNDHDVVAVTRAAEALARIDRGERYDAILCDLMMPEVTGMELHRELTARHPDASRRVVFVTGGAFTPEARAFLDRVPNPRVDKPVDRANLEAAIRLVAGG